MDNNEENLLKLPKFVYSKEQVQSLIKEITSIEDFLYKGRVRESGSKMSLPKTTSELDDFADANNRNVLQHNQRMELAGFLRKVSKDAPEVAILLESNNKQIVEGIAEWFRKNIHAQTLLRVNTNPRVGAGCMLRIKHKTYDFTLRNRLADISHTSSALATSNDTRLNRARQY